MTRDPRAGEGQSWGPSLLGWRGLLAEGAEVDGEEGGADGVGARLGGVLGSERESADSCCGRGGLLPRDERRKTHECRKLCKDSAHVATKSVMCD